MIPLFKVRMPEASIKNVISTLRSGYIGQGPRVADFEAALAGWIGHERVLAVNSGTSALQLALRTANVGVGDSVVSTPMTCLATNAAIRAVGADIIWADVDPTSGSIVPSDIAMKIRSNTKAIMVVHWGGMPVDLDSINTVARERGLYVIEDAAQAIGSSYGGKRIGNHSDFVCFSFQAVKQLTTGDGGAIAFRRADDYERARLLRWYGLPRGAINGRSHLTSDVVEVGYKYHMNDVAATIGLGQMPALPAVIDSHRRNAHYYEEALAGFGVVREASGSRSSFWLYTLHVANRESFEQAMRTAGVEVSRVHARNDLYTAFRAYRTPLPGLDSFAKSMMCIPVGWWVDARQASYIARCVLRHGVPRDGSREG